MENPESSCVIFSTNPSSFVLFYTFYRRYVALGDDFNDLVDPHTLALHCLGSKPFAHILCTTKIEEKKSKYLLSSSLSLPFPLFPPPPFFFKQVFSFCKDDNEI